jgi:hypothetical protein
VLEGGSQAARKLKYLAVKVRGQKENQTRDALASTQWLKSNIES